VDFVLLLWELDRSSLQQAFGPYASQDDADVALVELGNWPSLHGAWEILPLTRVGETSPASVPLLPSIPYAPFTPAPMTPTPVVPLWPRDGVVWCGAERAPYAAPGWTGCAPAATTPYTIWTTGMPPSPRDEEPPDMAVPARV
jgi:hypothetical protein